MEKVSSNEGGPFTPTCGPIINTDAIRESKIKDCTARRILLTTIELKLNNRTTERWLAEKQHSRF
ncbi:Uncharacterized protein APZ42_007333 [Daphnia magna]|uniref:Uncharacterized protein n=1 Tax=Daphnia magna TaxID=35525 RepID=A0A162D252_9CRUS|nr:Uncharacterized protein APZ42_007333 [Daphnia magna]